MINKIIVCDTMQTRNAVNELIKLHNYTTLFVCPQYYGLQITNLANEKESTQIHSIINIKFGGRVSIVPEIGNG